MIRPYILAETNWKNIREENFELAVLPWAATEAHNYHLPYATDIIEGDAIAAESARIAWEAGARVIVLPAIPFGVNSGQADIKLDIHLNPSTQAAILHDILTTLNRQGIKKFMLFNSHGGNNWKAIIRQLGLDFPDMFLCVTHWFKSLDKPTYFENQGDHADEMETSLILHLRPELVLPRREWGSGAEKKNKVKAFQSNWAWTERPWSTISEDTGVGDPSKATADKGKRFFNAVSVQMGQLFIDLCAADIDDLYE